MTLAADAVSLRRNATDILKYVSLRGRPGVVLGIIGPNGAGKSSLLRMLSGALPPDTGRVLLNDMPLADVGPRRQARARALMEQSSNIAFDFTVREVIEFGWVQAGLWTRDYAEEALQTVIIDCRIESLLERTFNTLSGGEQQRVQFARALLQVWRPPSCNDARYLLLDEPTASLDLAHELLVLNLVRRAALRNISVLVVLHDLSLAARFCDELLLLAHGEALSAGPPRSVLTSELLSAVYRTEIRVEWHEALGRLMIHS